MNGTNSTRSGTIFHLLWMVVVLFFGSGTDVKAQITGSCKKSYVKKINISLTNEYSQF